MSQGGEEQTQVVRRLDQFADHADGLFARVEVDVALSSICLPCSKIVHAGINRCPDLIRFHGSAALCSPSFFSDFAVLHLSDVLSCIPGVWFVASMTLVRNRQFVHHAHERDEVGVCPSVYLFRWSLSSRNRVFFSTFKQPHR